MTEIEELKINTIIENMRHWLADEETSPAYIERDFARKFVNTWHESLLSLGTWRKNGV